MLKRTRLLWRYLQKRGCRTQGRCPVPVIGSVPTVCDRLTKLGLPVLGSEPLVSPGPFGPTRPAGYWDGALGFGRPVGPNTVSRFLGRRPCSAGPGIQQQTLNSTAGETKRAVRHLLSPRPTQWAWSSKKVTIQEKDNPRMASCTIPSGPNVQSAHTGPTPLATFHVACDTPQPGGRISVHSFALCTEATSPRRPSPVPCTLPPAETDFGTIRSQRAHPEHHVPEGAADAVDAPVHLGPLVRLDTGNASGRAMELALRQEA